MESIDSKTPGSNRAVCKTMKLKQAAQCYHESRKTRLKSRIVDLAMAGKITPQTAHWALVSAGLVRS